MGIRVGGLKLGFVAAVGGQWRAVRNCRKFGAASEMPTDKAGQFGPQPLVREVGGRFAAGPWLVFGKGQKNLGAGCASVIGGAHQGGAPEGVAGLGVAAGDEQPGELWIAGGCGKVKRGAQVFVGLGKVAVGGELFCAVEVFAVDGDHQGGHAAFVLGFGVGAGQKFADAGGVAPECGGHEGVFGVCAGVLGVGKGKQGADALGLVLVGGENKRRASVVGVGQKRVRSAGDGLGDKFRAAVEAGVEERLLCLVSGGRCVFFHIFVLGAVVLCACVSDRSVVKVSVLGVVAGKGWRRLCRVRAALSWRGKSRRSSRQAYSVRTCARGRPPGASVRCCASSA